MDSNTAEADLPDNYLSPRSKVAQMLADIDDAPTPSPSPVKHDNAQLTARSNMDQARDVQSSIAEPHLPQEKHQRPPDEDDVSPTRPAGRAARRMLNQRTGSDDELYSLTPMRPRRAQRSTPAGPSPMQSMRSPGLFVSPTRSLSPADSDDSLFDNPLGQPSRLADLVAAKRSERLAKEKAPRDIDSPVHASSDLPDEIVETIDDAPLEPGLEKLLSDAARPTRKASKKAMLEMERETQRLAREQALTHQMKTKRKFTTSDLFARMNFRQGNRPQETISTSSSAPNSDAAEADVRDPAPREPFSTPPSSPPTPWDAQKALVDRGALARMVPVREDSITSLAAMPLSGDDDDDDGLQDLDHIIKQSRMTKGPAKQVAAGSPSRAAASRVRTMVRQLQTQPEDSDEDLDIIQSMPAHLKVFDRVKPVSKRGEVHSKAIHALKHLAHLTHDTATARGKKALKPIVPPTAINAQLIATAKAQARQAQQERLAELQAKGVTILSAEEQEKEHAQFENLLEKARQEAQEIRKQEKAARRKAGDESHAVASDDEDEDADWQDSEDEDEAAVEFERDELIDDVAEDSVSEDGSLSNDNSDTAEPADEIVEQVAIPRATRKPRIIIDEDDEDDVEPRLSKTTDPVDDPFAAFGFSTTTGSLMSPTQAFAATMRTPTQSTQALARGTHSALRYEHPPPPTFGQPPSQDELGDTQSQLVPASQLQENTQLIHFDWETQMPETPVPEFKSVSNNMIETPGWEPSQDAGLPSPWTVARCGELFTPASNEHETQSTVCVRISESPEVDIPRNRGRLTRGVKVIESHDDERPVKKSKNAFAEMQRLRMESMNATDRAAAQKEMRDMMDDQAEESEDEYAGLGGDDSNMIAPETEEDRAMIDESKIEIDEQQERDMRKFYAERQRAAEEEATSKLFKDLTTGALRRRQGVDWELDEDEDELAARRRQIKQREEARKRRLLLQDVNVKGLLEGKGDSKGREAFLRTIGDDGEGDDQEDFVRVGEANDYELQTVTLETEPLRETSNNKRPLEHPHQDLPAAKAKRTRIDDYAFSRPTSMLQVRESLSFLLDEPIHTTLDEPGSQEGEDDDTSDNEYEENNAVEEELCRDNDGGWAPDVPSQSQEMPPPPLPTERLPASQRRTPAKPAVIDRLSLRRGSSSSSSTSSMGWSAWSTASGAASKVPSLLRKATSNLSATSSTNERGVSFSNGNANDRGVSIGGGASTGGSKKSSLAYQSRAQERKALGERAERKKEENRRKIAEIRRQQGGALVNGGFEGVQWE